MREAPTRLAAAVIAPSAGEISAKSCVILGIDLLSRGLFIPRFCLFPGSPAHLIILLIQDAGRSWTGYRFRSSLPVRCTFRATECGSRGLVQDCPRGSSPEFTRFATRHRCRVGHAVFDYQGAGKSMVAHNGECGNEDSRLNGRRERMA